MTKPNPSKKSTPPTLRYRGVTKDHRDVRALGPIDLRIRAGEAVALLGHNGSGKSTLLGLAAGAVEPTEGKVKVNGELAGSDEARGAVSFVRDHPVLYEDISVREHLEFLTRLHGTDPDAQEADAVLERLGLLARADDVPGSLSRGLRQKASLAIAYCRPFDLLLIDEPFAGLDPAGKESLLELVTDARERGAACVVATHDMTTPDRFTRVVVLQEGDIVFDGPPGEVPDSFDGPDIFDEEDDGA